MDIEFWKAVITGAITGIFSAGAIWGVMSTKMAWLARDVEAAHIRIDRHEERYHPPHEGK